MLGVLFGLVFIEQGNDLAHHRLHGLAFVADGLGNRNGPDPMLRKLAKVELLLKGLSEKSAVAVDDDVVERLPAIAGAFDHLLEDRAAIVAQSCQTERKVDARLNDRHHGRWTLGAAPERPAEGAGDSEVDVLDGDAVERGMVRYFLVICEGRWRDRDGRSCLSSCRNAFRRRTAYNSWWRWISAEVLFWGT